MKRGILMNWKFAAAVVAGFTTGFAVANYLEEVSHADPEHVLDEIKKKFRTLGPVEGTWIVMKPELFNNGVLDFDVYQGGITVKQAKQAVQYQFIADAKTGSILHVKQQADS